MGEVVYWRIGCLSTGGLRGRGDRQGKPGICLFPGILSKDGSQRQAKGGCRFAPELGQDTGCITVHAPNRCPTRPASRPTAPKPPGRLPHRPARTGNLFPRSASVLGSPHPPPFLVKGANAALHFFPRALPAVLSRTSGLDPLPYKGPALSAACAEPACVRPRQV